MPDLITCIRTRPALEALRWADVHQVYTLRSAQQSSGGSKVPVALAGWLGGCWLLAGWRAGWVALLAGCWLAEEPASRVRILVGTTRTVMKLLVRTLSQVCVLAWRDAGWDSGWVGGWVEFRVAVI